MPNPKPISRREFVRLAATSVGALVLPISQHHFNARNLNWPSLRLDAVPLPAQNILSLVPETIIGAGGDLFLLGTKDHLAGRVPLAQTQWNRENNHQADRLYSGVPWGIVLHWFGDKENFDKSITSYLRGFDSLRQVDDYETRTSAHFLVGDDLPALASDGQDNLVGIIQTQKPHPDGSPYVASHISGLDYEAHKAHRQYFVRALYQLESSEPGGHSILQDWFDGGRAIDPNMHTIAIEMTGYDFETREHFPPKQQIANAISVIWALMQHYKIPAKNLFGHHEIQLNKADPGKKFMGLIRYLIGVKALTEDDPLMNDLVFGDFLNADSDTLLGTQKYFKYVYDHLLLVSSPNRVYEWEALSGYWFISDLLHNQPSSSLITRNFLSPLSGKFTTSGRSFTHPANHEGIDLHRGEGTQNPLGEQALLVSKGICIHLGENDGCIGGKSTIFRHRQLNGCEVLSVYGHLDQVFDLQIGTQYPTHYPLGVIRQDHTHIEPFLHFAMAYGGTWYTDLNTRTTIPHNVGAYWIKERYFNPFNLMNSGSGGPSSAQYSVS